MSQLLFPFPAAPSRPETGQRAEAPPAQSGARGQRQPESALVLTRPSHEKAAAPEKVVPPAPRIDLFLSTAQILAEKIERWSDEAVEVELTDNAWTMVSYKRIDGRLCFRLHHMFCSAPDEVVRALAGFTGRARKQHGKTIDQYIRGNRQLIRAVPVSDARPLQTRGEVHDLAEIYARLNETLFQRRIDARIGWGRRAPDRRRRSIKMGVYFHDQRLIRIHPALDDARVPRLFVELVTFHEMLHQAIPPKSDDEGRRCVHGPEFRAAERRFPGYAEARAWEKAHLHLLLRKPSP